MKTVWITCAILSACGCICGIGLFVTGRGLLQASRKVDAEADKFATDTVEAVCHSWDAKALSSRLAPDADPGLADSVIKQGKPLGALVKETPFAVVGHGWSNVNGVKTSKIRTGSDATFEHGTARIELTLTNNGSGWHIVKFEFNPKPNDSGVTQV